MDNLEKENEIKTLLQMLGIQHPTSDQIKKLETILLTTLEEGRREVQLERGEG